VFKKLCLIGVGLIGGSIAKAARKHAIVETVVAYGEEEHVANLQLAVDLGVIDNYTSDIAQALDGADLVIIATPVGAIHHIAELLLPHWNPECIYSDVGSTKSNVVDAIHAVFGYVPVNFIPAHPIAGAERSGVSAAREDLFSGRRLIITPLINSDPLAVSQLSRFWQSLGSSVSTMSVLAFALVAMLGRKDEQKEIFKYAAGGFKDFSRIASSDPTMWQDICLANKQHILPLIQQLKSEITSIEDLITHNQATELFETFTYARNARQRYLDQLED
jgi:prephenate dehydrogenase